MESDGMIVSVKLR